MKERTLSSQIFVGLILILIGLAFLLRNLGWADFSGVARWIPSFFILLGIWQLVANKFRFITGPLILIVGGIAFQLAAFDVIEFSSIWQFWPLILILIGGSILLERAGIKLPQPFTHNEDEATVSILSIFNGPEHTVTSPEFKGGEATAVFGGIDLDLRQAAVVERPAHINTFAMFGGVDIIVPAGWAVKTDVIGIFGGADDERTDKISDRGDQSELLVTGFAMFGGITVKN
jgi:predicted membrane protein